MPLRPVTLDDALIGQPLAWDVYTASGVLVAGAGLIIADAAQLARLRARPLYRRADSGDDDSHLATRLRAVMADYPAILRTTGSGDLETAVRGLARELIALTRADRDACLGLARLLPMRDRAARHSLIVTLVALDLGETLGQEDNAQESLAAAALTMNIAALPLHAGLADGTLRFTPEAREAMRRHPDDGVARLSAEGIADPVWLAAVRQHHEHLDGSGYPAGLRDEAIGLPARLIRVADYYVAKITGRHYRPPKTAQFAIKELLGGERGRLDGQIAALLPRRFGLYPPGTLLRLASREIALVPRHAGHTDAAGVATVVLNPRGQPAREASERNTAQADFAVLGIAEVEPTWPAIGWEACWGY